MLPSEITFMENLVDLAQNHDGAIYLSSGKIVQVCTSAETAQSHQLVNSWLDLKALVQKLKLDGLIEEVYHRVGDGFHIRPTYKGLHFLEFIKEEKDKEKSSRNHDYRLALFSFVGGGVMGFLTSLCFWLLS